MLDIADGGKAYKTSEVGDWLAAKILANTIELFEICNLELYQKKHFFKVYFDSKS